MVTFREALPDDGLLYKAIRAQLTASSLILERVAIPSSIAAWGDAEVNAATLGEAHRAALVFWAEDAEGDRWCFFVPEKGGGAISKRTLALGADHRSSRSEAIAIAVASTIEGLLAPVLKQTVKHIEAPRPSPPAPSSSRHIPQPPNIELSLGYEGVYFSDDIVLHGARVSMGVLPPSRLIVAVAYTQRLSSGFDKGALTLSIASRIVEISVAVRFDLSPLELRLGLAGAVDLRSYSTSVSSDWGRSEPDGFRAVGAVMPFGSMLWKFQERFGLFGRLGAAVALNETAYKFTDSNGETVSLCEPFLFKLTFQLGLTVWL